MKLKTKMSRDTGFNSTLVKCINNVIKSIVFMILIIVFTLVKGTDVKAASGPLGSFKINQYEANCINEGLEITTIEGGTGISTSFEITASDRDYALTIYTPTDPSGLNDNGQCSAYKHEFIFRKISTGFEYKHRINSYDPEKPGDDKWKNETATYRETISKYHTDRRLLIKPDGDDDKAYIGGAYGDVIGDYYTINDTNYAFKVSSEGEKTIVTTFISTNSLLKNYMFDVTLEASGDKKTLYLFKNLKYTAGSIIMDKKEYANIAFATPFSHNGSGKIEKCQLSDECVNNIYFVIKDGLDGGATQLSKTNIRLSNQTKAQNKLNYYDADAKTYNNYIDTSNINLAGSSIYYTFMKPLILNEGEDNQEQMNYFDEAIVKGFTLPSYDIERRNIKETYVKIRPYPQNGKYYLDLKTKSGGSWSTIENYSSQFVFYDPGNTNDIMMPINIDLTNDLTYKVVIYYAPEGEEDAKGDPIVISTTTDEFVPSDDYQVTVGVPLREEVNNIIVINDENHSPIVAQFDLSFDVPIGIFDVFHNNSSIHNEDLKHNLWYELYLNTKLISSKDNPGDPSNDENYAIADIIYLDFHDNTDKSKSYFEITTQNTTNKHGTPTWTGRINYGDKRVTAKIVLRPYNNDDFTTLSSGFYSFYQRDYEDLNGRLASGTTSNKIGTYKQFDLDSNNKKDGGVSNSYFRNDPASKIEETGSNYYLSLTSAFIANYDPSSNPEDPDKSDIYINYSDPSVSVNVVFQANSDVIPVTDKLEFENVIKGTRTVDSSNELGGKISGVDGTTYYNKMLEPVGESLDDMRFEIFISEDLDTLKYVISDVNYAKEQNDVYEIEIDSAHMPSNAIVPTVEFKTEGDYKTSFNINFLRNHCISNSSIVTKGVYAFYTDNLYDSLNKYKSKNGEILIQGLDSNTTYYLVVRTAFEIGGEYRYSDFSKIFSKSTSTKPVVPKENEIYPPAPEQFGKALDVITDDTKGAVKWRTPSNLDNNSYTYAYEIVRVADERLSEANKSQQLTMKDLYDKKLSQFVGAKIDKDYGTSSDYPNTLSLFNGTGYEFPGADSLYTISTFPTYSYKFIDAGLKPNRIYFYYVRTVQKMLKLDPIAGKMVETGEQIYSEWAEVTITTIPIEGILNLREIPIPAQYKIQEFNSFYERIIAFDAPKGTGMVAGDGLNKTSVLPDGKDFIVSIKEAEEEEYYIAPSVVLEAIEPITDSEFATFVYRIEKLRSGTKYNVRVAAVDTSVVEDDGNYPVSTYSDSISIRTEFNQDDYNRDTKYKEYETYYNAKLGKINNDLGFVLEDDTANYTVKFKEDKLQGALAATNNSTYMLPTNDDAYMFTYYISNNNIKEMMRLKKGLRLDHDGVSVVIPYNFINDDYNKFYGDLLKNCDSIKSDVEDFYMKLWVGFTKPQSYVQGNKTSSDQVQIAIKFIELDSYVADLDGQLEQEIDDYIEDNKDKFFVDVKKQLNNEIDDAKLIEYVEDEENEIREYIKKLANSYYSDYELESYNMTDLYNDINVKFRTNDSSSKIYTKAPNDTKWSQVRTTNSGGYANGYISKLGNTVLTSSADTNIIYGTEETANAYYAKSKYNLDSVLIQNGILNPKQDRVTQSLFYDTAFAIMQTDINDVFSLAKQKQKLDNSFAFFNDPLTRQEILYGVMQLYDEFNPVNVNQVVINNANLATGITFNNYYKQSILAGYQMGLFTLDEIKNPNSYMSVDEMLNIIYRVIG